MQTEKKVFEKLFAHDKVELKSKKVELGILDDINNLRVQLSNYNSEIQQKGDVVKSNFRDVQNLGEKALMLFKQGNNYISQVNKLYEEIGFPGNAESETEVKQLLLQMDLLLKYRKSYNF
jgi:hypothetical protein